MTPVIRKASSEIRLIDLNVSGIEYILSLDHDPDNFITAEELFKSIVLKGFRNIFNRQIVNRRCKRQMEEMPGKEKGDDGRCLK